MKIFIIYYLIASSFIHAYTYPEAQIDLDYMYKAILENHPGMYNRQDPF